jgi:MYXO-CTERM domain-containing protein
MQWLGGCNGVRVPGNGTFNLVPLETSCPSGTQVLQVPFPATLVVSDPQSTNPMVNLKNYYLELRVAGGSFDTYTTSGRGGGSSLSFAGPTVFLYTSDDVRVPTTTGRGGGQNSVWTELLNTTPSGTPFTGLSAAGQSFTDPAGGPTITLQAISATGATITVTNAMGTGAGTATCIDGSAFVEPGPASCGPTGAGGTTGAAGTSGAAGATGAAGTTGAGGRGGAAAGTTGSAGAGSGAGGAAAGSAGTGAIPHEGAVTGGCACGVADGGGAGANPVGMGVVLVTLGLALGRRRHRRRGRSS